MHSEHRSTIILRFCYLPALLVASLDIIKPKPQQHPHACVEHPYPIYCCLPCLNVTYTSM